MAKTNINTQENTELTSVVKPPIRYFEAVGRRKEAVARVRITEGTPKILVNDKELNLYFPSQDLQEKVIFPLRITSTLNKFFVTVKVKGGGLTGQAEAIRLGLSRALLKFDETFKPILRANGLLTRDARVVERKKYGLRKARRARQWRKR
ncbi:MAG: 30S ribosomal protein S9 [Candidatus Pacebacteria bacterium]|nr:30S ribosomal protein S9 [Candidatus Paceibacterota bacterium]MDD3434439.1 30S ribosomal protein S9 [Candidatus Paceibacterota bacterium]